MSNNILEELKKYGLIPCILNKDKIILADDSKTDLSGNDTEGFVNMEKLFVPESVTSIKWNGLGRHRFSCFIVSSENPVFQVKEGVLYTKRGFDRNGSSRRKHMLELVACPTLVKKHVILPMTKRIAHCAFKGCKISELILPDSIEEIGKNAFYQTPNLTKIVIPQNIRLISPQERVSFTKVLYLGVEFNSWSKLIEYMLENGFVMVNGNVSRQKANK